MPPSHLDDRDASLSSMTTIETWRLLPFGRLPAGDQAAWTEALLTGVAQTRVPALHWRETSPEALTLGRGQPLTHVDLSACHAAGVPVYRRATGGTAVLSGPDLLGLDIALPAGHRLSPANVAESYRWLGEALAAGLRALGVAAETVSPQAARAQAASLEPDDPVRRACFATLSPYEVTVAERKLAGLAQLRRGGAVLLQAGILMRWNAERLASLLAVPPELRARSVHALHDRAIGLDEVALGLEREDLIAQLTTAIAKRADADQRVDEWSAEERAGFQQALAQFEPIA
jgi:lipoate-protein ligase A